MALSISYGELSTLCGSVELAIMMSSFDHFAEYCSISVPGWIGHGKITLSPGATVKFVLSEVSDGTIICSAVQGWKHL